MSEWKTYKLGDLIEKITKGTTPSTLGGGFVEGGINFIKSEAVGYDGRIDKSTFVFITEETNQKLKRSQLQEGDILFSMAGIFLGKNAIVTKDILPANTNQALAIIRLKKETTTPIFVHYFLRQKDIVKKINSMSGQSAQPNINFEEIKSIEINLPNAQTQTQIAQILTSLDDKIELNLQMNQTLEAMAQALFKEWFVDFRFPGFDGVLENDLPKGWSYKTIKDLGKVVTGSTPSIKNPEYFGEITPFVTPTDFKNFGKLIIGATRYLSNEGSKAMKTRLLPKYSIIVTCIGSDMGKVAINSIECITNQQINSVILNDKNFVDYLYYYLVYKYDYLRNIATGGSTMPIINKSRFEEIEIVIPNSDILENFQALMDSFNSKIEENIRQIQALTQTRDALLPKLMSGQIAIK